MYLLDDQMHNKNSRPSLEELMKKMTISNIQFQQKYECHHPRPTDSYWTVSYNCQPVAATRFWQYSCTTNYQSKRNMSAITMRSGRELPKPINVGAKIDDSAKIDFAPKQIPLPFPSRSIPPKKVELGSHLLETFRRVEVNIPLLDTIKKFQNMQSS